MNFAGICLNELYFSIFVSILTRLWMLFGVDNFYSLALADEIEDVFY